MSSKSSTAAQETKRVFLFNISGLIGTALFWVVFQALETYLPVKKSLRSTAAWTTAYLLSIIWQHFLHQALVFGFAKHYLNSLLATYAAYGISIALSSVFTYILETWLGLTGNIAFGCSTAATGVINYLTVKNAFALSESSDESSKTK